MTKLFDFKKPAIAIAFLILLGTIARFSGLDTHFTHIDDIGVARTIIFDSKMANSGENLLRKITVIPRSFTYAPLQFLLTYPLVSPRQSYRQILFWGRFPSCLFGILGLLSLVLFFKRYDRFKTPAAFIGLTLLAFSYENVIYAQQMESYSIGVFAAIGVLILLFWQMRSRTLSFKKLLVSFTGMAFLSHAQYQIIFFLPAFAFTLFVYYLFRIWPRWFKTLRDFLGAGLAYGLMVFPEYWHFVRPIEASQPGVTWNAGVHNEFRLQLLAGSSFFVKCSGTLAFFLKNFPLVFGSMLAFMPENHPLFQPAVIFLLALFILGMAGLLLSRRLQKKMLFVFFLSVALTWIALVSSQKLAFSPTRHSLILLPFFAVITAEGWNVLLKFLKRFTGTRPFRRFAHIPLIGFILLMFWAHFPQFIKERKDPFDEREIEQKITEFEVDAVIATGWTWNLSLMKGVRDKITYFEEEFHVPPWNRPRPVPYRTLAFVSQRKKLDQKLFDDMKYVMNLYSIMPERRWDLLLPAFRDYRLVYSKEITSDVEVDFSGRTQNGTNGLYFYILRKD